MIRPPCSWPKQAALVIVLAVLPAVAHAARAQLNGDWQGSITAGAGSGSALATLTQRGARLGGTIAVDAGSVHGTFVLAGRVGPAGVRMRGRLGRARLVWHGTVAADPSSWSGAFTVRGGGQHLRGVLVLSPRGGTPCGADYFASDVLPRVLQPICSHCHVPDGLAMNAPFRVTLGDPMATMLSALREVDLANPSQSKILRKPRGEVGHGGGRQIVPGSPEDQVLSQWVALVTAAGCQGPTAPGGGGGPRPVGGAALYADQCASCHGTDAHGLQGRPDIHCNRDIHDVVRNGRTGPAGTMPAFTDLSDVEIADIQEYLVGLCPTTAVTGADIYAGNCAGCHGGDARGLAGAGPTVRCSKSIRDPVRNGVPPMPALPGLTDADIALVQAYLDSLCPAGTGSGVELWIGNCAYCHGTDAGGVGVAPNVRCATRVADAAARGRGAAMPSFPELTVTDVDAVAAYLDTLCTSYGRTGDALYAGNCSTCHGPTAHGGTNGLGVRGPDISCTGANDFTDAVRSGDDGMPSFPALTAGDVAAIVAFVQGSYCAGD